MLNEWQLQQAKGNFSQLIKRAASGDAQTVTVHGKPTAVVLSAEEYTRLTARRQARQRPAATRARGRRPGHRAQP